MYLPFEKPVVDLQSKISELQAMASEKDLDLADEIKNLIQKKNALLESVFKQLSPWERTQLSRHPQRPYSLDYIKHIFDGFEELHGDRAFMDDAAIVGGIAQMGSDPIMVIAHQKGRSTKDKIHRNFGMPKPEGYRKALRLMKLAERFSMPLLTLIDTPGAYPGVGAEERGQAQAIAQNIYEMSVLNVPSMSVVIGEGGSGGALALGVTDAIWMMEYAVYSVISPESCAAILWRDAAKAEQAAKSLKLTAADAKGFGIVDGVIKEPLGGAHQNLVEASKSLLEAVKTQMALLKGQMQDQSMGSLLESRYQKYREIGVFEPTS